MLLTTHKDSFRFCVRRKSVIIVFENIKLVLLASLSVLKSNSAARINRGRQPISLFKTKVFNIWACVDLRSRFLRFAVLLLLYF